MDNNYIEIGEQIFNLVDNDKDTVNSFYDALAQEDEKGSIQSWIEDNVKDNELQDLYKSGQDNTGLINWVTSEKGHDYFMKTPTEINTNNVNKKLPSYDEMIPNTTQIHKDIETEDDEIMSTNQMRIKNDMSDGEYSSDKIDDDDEIQMALDALDSSDDEEDINVVFDIMDGSDSEDDFDFYEGDSSEETSDELDYEEIDSSDNADYESSDDYFEVDSSDEDSSDDEDYEESDEYDSSEEETEIIHKKRIYLDHHVNKVVRTIDDEEEVDRFTHKKYYVMKKPELGSLENMNKLEDELDKENISYYDFGKNDTIAIKIYSQNEVKLNRIFESLGFDSRCVDIAHYTDDWYSKPQD